jgi:serine/threonine protein kinase
MEFGRVIGTGLMGTVRVACVKKDQQYVVVKSVAKDYVCKHNDGRHVQNEREVLSRFDHPFIVKLFGTYQDDKHIHFVLEFVAGGELFSRLQRHSCFAAESAKFYLCEVFLALAYVHKLGFVYRDLKPENILLDETGHCKLVDFGFTTKPNENGVMRTQVGTPMYLSPEQLNSKFTKGYTKIVDWWAFACITYELMVGLTPFCKDNKESAHAIYLRVLKGKVKFPSHFDKRAKDLVTKLLVADINKRMTEPADIQKHDWFSDVDWDGVEDKRAVPPSKPHLKQPGDVHYFDEMPEDRSLDRRPLAKVDHSLFNGF